MIKNKYLLMLAVALLSFVSCKKYLDIKPKGLDIVKTTDQYNGLFNNSTLFTLSNFRTSSSGVVTILGSAEMPVYMGDDVLSFSANLNNSTVSQQNAFKWEDNVYQPDEESNEWSAFYSQNYVYNVVANGVMASENGTEQKKKELLAEARANRAFNFFLIGNIFGQPYKASSAATDLSVPLVTLPDVSQSNFTRATVKEMYDFIVKELRESIPDLPSFNSRIRMTKAAAQYMLGQVYVWMGDYNNALQQLNNAKSSLSGGAISARFYDYNTVMNSAPPTGWYSSTLPHRGASGYPFQYNSDETIFLKQITTTFIISRATLFLKPSVLNLYNASDLRLKFFYNKDFQTGGTALPGFIRNSPGSANWGPGLPNLYLMLAECKARTGDLTGAKADLEALRASRMPAALVPVTVTTQDAMVRFVLAERQREFALTGLRWFDMRRLANDPVYNNIDATHPLDAASVPLRPERLTMRIPPSILGYNPGMKDNP